MKKYFIATTISLALIASQPSLASPPKPAKCPSVSALQNSNFNFAKKQYEGGWAVGDLQSNYDTVDSWTFFVFDITANNEQGAITNANRSIKNLAFNAGPSFYAEKERWACFYMTSEGNYAASYTPVVNPDEIFAIK